MKKTTWFAVFVVLLVAVTYYVEFYQAGQEASEKAEAARIVGFPVEQINQIEIQNQSGKILLKRDTEGWRLEEPVQDWADNQFTEDFVNGLAGESTLDSISNEAGITWSVYGLEKDFSKVVFTNQQGKSVAVLVSQKKNFEGNSFLRRDNEDKVLTATSQWILRANKTALDFRDKRFFRGKISAVETIDIKSKKDQFQLVKKDGRWINEKKPKIKVDQNRVREILTSLNEIRATEFLDKLPTAQEVTQIQLKLNEKSWTGELKQGADKTFYGVTSEPAFKLKLATEAVDKFANMTFMSLRDRKEPFDFQNLLVQRIEITTPVKKMALVKEKEDWTLEGDAKVVIDANSIRGFISRLSDTGVTEYLEKKEQAAFKNPENHLVLKDENQKIIYELNWGPTLNKKALVGETKLILAKSSLFEDVFGLDPAVVEAWNLMGLLPKEQNKDKQEKDTP